MRQIVAMGGGGFTMEPENTLLDDYVLSLSGQERPRVCFVPTASGDSDATMVRFYEAFPVTRALPSHLPLMRRQLAPEVRAHLLAQDVIYVGGGSTVNMLAMWRAHGVDSALREAWENGVVLCGVSAGSLCWYEAGVTDSYGRLAPLRDGLGLLAGSHCPHYDGEPDRRPAYQGLVAGGLPAGIAADDGVGLHYVGSSLERIVSSREGAAAYRVSAVGGEAVEERLEAGFLGAGSPDPAA